MGKKRGGFGGRKQGKPESEGPRRAPITLREEATGKLQTKESTSVKSILKVDHLKKLAVWASQEAQIPSLGAFYGHQLAAVAEAAGVPPDPSLITCQRCETVLHPGFNSTVRIEKTRSKVRHRRNKPVNKTQNNVVYKCHFCLHQNVKRGTPKGYAHIKGKLPSRNKSSLESRPPTESITQECSKSEKSIICEDKANEVGVFASQVVAKDVSLVDGLATPSSVSTTTTTLEGKKRKRNRSKSEKSIICEDKVNEVGVFASQVVAKEVSLVDGPANPSSVSTTTTTLEGKKRKRNSSKSEKSIICEDKVNEVGVFASQVVAKDVSLVDGPATPSSVSTSTTTLEGKKRRRNSSTSKKGAETAGMSAISEASKTPSKSSKSFIWPDAAVPAIVALEKASHDALSSAQKYNKTLRQLGYNLKKNALLAHRLLNGELESSKMLNMTPNELKEACTAEEMGKKESDEPQLMQMTDARCQRCNECKVGLRHIIHAGHGDRYQLECVASGNSLYAFRDEVSILTTDAPVSKKNLDTEPLATEKVQDFEKKPVSPSEPGKQSHDDSKTSEG